MKKRNIAILVSASLVAVGTALCAGALISSDFNFRNLSRYEQSFKETNIKTTDISDINVDMDWGDINILQGESNDIIIRYYQSEHRYFDINAENGVLKVSERYQNKNFLFNLNFGYSNNFIDIEIPKNCALSYNITNHLGDISVQNVSGKRAVFDSQSGDIEIYGGEFESVSGEISNGDINITGTKGSDCRLVNKNGDIGIDMITFDHITLENNLGDIDGTIDATQSDYSINCSVNLGDKTLLNQTANTDKFLNATNSLGDIDIVFTK